MTHVVDLPEIFRLTLRATHQGIFDLNVQTGAASVSSEYALMLGYDPETFVESNAAWLDRVHQDDRARVGADYLDYIQGRTDTYRTEFRQRTADGRWKWILSLGCIVERTNNGQPLRMVGTHTDITERKAQEAHLRLQSAALNAAVDAIVIADGHGTMQWVNKSFMKLLRSEHTDLIGQHIGMFQPVVTDGPIAAIWTTLRAGRPWVGEVTIVRHDGSPCVASAALTPVTDADGVPRHFIGVLRDVTEARRVQQQQVAAQKMEIVGRLAGTVAHDFNNLLGVINGTADLAAMGLAPGDPVRVDLEAIRRAGDRAAVLTRQLLALTRKQVAAPQVIDLHVALVTLRPMLERTAGETITFEVRPNATRPTIRVDPGQLEQVIMNLVVNAKDAMPTGGLVSIETRDVDAGISLAIRDTGSGITPDILPHIFEPFFTTKDSSKGTGLGLPTVVSIVEGAGGRVGVESREGHGTTFTLTWPRIQVPDKDEAMTSANPTSNGTVLVVEDDGPLLGLISRVLTGAGYAVVTASSAEDAEAPLRRHLAELDLLLTDVVLPGASGITFADHAQALRPTMSVLFMSGYPDEELGAVTGGALGDRLIRKPFSAGHLVTTVRAHLGRHRSTKT
jgi:two-component system, cell cycle sensor histidine kinase and response regulator CckA